MENVTENTTTVETLQSPPAATETIQEETAETKKINGLAAYQEKMRKEKELKSLINQETKATNAITTSPEAEIDLKKTVDITKTYIFESIVKSKNPRNEMISNTCKVFDSVKNRIREIRYIEIADTIWADEMGDRYKGLSSDPISIYNNRLDVPGTNQRLVEFLMHHDEYDGNPQRLSKRPPMFTLSNKEAVELRKEEMFTYELKAMNLINDSDLRDLLPIARFLFNVVESDALTVKNRLREEAKKNPLKIIKNIDSPRVMRGYLIQMALDHGILEVDLVSKNLTWKATGAFVKEMVTADPNEVVAEISDFTFTEVGGKIYDIIKSRVKY